MKHKKNAKGNQFKNNITIILISILMILGCYIVQIATVHMGYLTNDDTSIQRRLSGAVTGKIYESHQFINVFLGIFVSSLYRLFPQIQWWYVYSQFLVIVGMILLHFAIFKLCKSRNVPVIIALFILITLDIVFFMYPIANISFTIVPSILGGGLIAIVFLLQNINNENVCKIAIGMLVIGYACVLFHRKQVGYVTVCYLLLSLLYCYMKKCGEIKATLKKYIPVALLLTIITIVFPAINTNYLKQINDEQFVKYNSARVMYADYPHDEYSENPNLYETVGWSRDLTFLVKRFYYMDENVTADAFRYISDNSVNKESGILIEESIGSAIDSVRNDKKTRCIFIIFLLSILMSFGISKNKWERYEYLCFVCNNLAGLIMLFYQVFNGRVLYRTLFVVFLPVVIINIFLMIENWDTLSKLKKVYMMCAFTVCCLVFISSMQTIFGPNRNQYKEDSYIQRCIVDEYVIERQPNIYIYTAGVFDNVTPWIIYEDKHPYNLISGGGSTYNSDAFKEQLKCNDIQQFDSHIFERENVYFIASANILNMKDVTNRTIATVLFQYLKKEYGAIGFNVVDELGDFAYVYEFVYDDNLKGADVYYDIQKGELCKIELSD